jgi:hypothetical protein
VTRRWVVITMALAMLAPAVRAADKPGVTIQPGKVIIYAFPPTAFDPHRATTPWPYPYPQYPAAHPAFPLAPFYPSYSAPAPYVPLGSPYPPPPVEIRGIELKPGGRLVIEVEPRDADVYVDGMRLTNRSEQGFDLGLLAGRHRVDVRRAGSQPWSQEVDVPAGGGLLITVELVDRTPAGGSEPAR